MNRRTIRPRGAGRPRKLTLTPQVDRLETRQVLSATAGLTVQPMYALGSLASSSPPSSAYTPAQIEQAYGFNNISFGSVKGDGTGETIAIVDAYDDPNIQSDLNTFDSTFGLAPATVTRVGEKGTTSLPPSDSTGGWELEESLDVEWAHAIAPGAKIVLVEASSTSDNDLLAGVTYAASVANVVSMSWGGSEFAGQASLDKDFSHAGVAFVASSGDQGAPISWPSASPNVLAVGGTALTLGTANAWGGETGWSGSGGGPSAYESQPSYQVGVVAQTTTKRANPDVAYDASPSTGFAVYDSFTGGGGWIQVGGTSAGAPQWSALLAIVDQGRALSHQPALNASSPQEVMTTLYKNATSGDFHDVTSGTSSGSPHYSAGTGYDYVTGLGSPVANLVAQSFDGNVTAPSLDHLSITASTSETAGASFNVTVTALTASGATDPNYTGTIAFTSTDTQAGLPGHYTFTTNDAGSHTFAITLKTAGTQSIAATDTASATVTGTLSGLSVSPAAASQIVLSGLSSSTIIGAPQTITVTMRDPYGNLATGYTGTVQFTSTDTLAGLPASYAFQASDAGSHTFNVTFNTAGTESVTVTDSVHGLSATSAGVSVALPTPTFLGATVVSSTQINLSWTGSTGATGYQIQESTNGTTGWTQVGTTAAGVTTFQSTGLTAGTTYYYRVLATTGTVTSAASNVASATTSGATGGGGTTGTSASDTIWSSTLVPNENAYSYGSYEVGVKFEANEAGTVTGMRFYKQTWMNGYSHVAHLWTAGGTLLATASFTNETASGWQQISFASPVAISANTVYVISFSTGGGYFGITTNYFGSNGVTNGPLQALGNSAITGGDGVYHTGNGTFPSVSGGGMNFWADVDFSPATSGSNVQKSVTTTGQPVGAIAPLGSAPAKPQAAPAPAAPAPVTTVTYRQAVPQATAASAFSWKGSLGVGA